MAMPPVGAARKESLPPILGADRPFMPFSKIKPTIWASSSLAQTMKTSAMGELEIHCLAPEME